MLAVAAATVLVATLVPRVLALLASPESSTTLARAFPGRVGGIFQRLADAPRILAFLVAMLPPLAWVTARLAGTLSGARPAVLHRGLAIAWTLSVIASGAAIVFPPVGLKQGLAALGYALAWPMVLSIVAVLWASDVSRIFSHAVLGAVILAGLVARALPLGWPGEHILTWWAMLPAVPAPLLAGSLAGVVLAAALACVVLARARTMPAAWALVVLAIASFLLVRSLPGLEHYGPAKHPAALASEINTSYFQASEEAGDARSFVQGHVARMPMLAMHARTHPPLWPLVFHAATRAGGTPWGAALARASARSLGADPRAAAELAASVASRPLSFAETNGLWLLVALLALAVAALPAATWFLARARMAPAPALRAAALAALLPAPLLYFPDVDVLHPALYALAAGAWLRRGHGVAWALLAGAIAACLAAFSFGNLALYAWFALAALLEWRSPRPTPRRELLAAGLALVPLAVLVVAAATAGAQPFAMFAEAMRQHRVILAHRSVPLWMALHPLECAVGLGFTLVFAFARGFDWSGLVARARARTMTGPEPLLGATLATLLVLDLSGTTRGESARLWMGWFPLLVAGGAGVLASREKGWARLALGLAATLVVLKGFYVFVWLYELR